MWNFMVYFSTLSFLFAISIASLPDYIKICNSNDTNISQCIINSIKILKPKLAAGIPELEVPALEPLDLDTIFIRQNVQSNITNLKIKGASTFEILDIKTNIPRHKFAFKVTIPKLEFEGNYQIDMKFLFVQIKGNGQLHGNISNYYADSLMVGNIVRNNNEDYLKFEKTKLRVKFGSTHLQLDNLFDGDPILGQISNSLINEHNELFFNEIVPVVEKKLAEKFTEIANKVTLKFPYKDLFP